MAQQLNIVDISNDIKAALQKAVDALNDINTNILPLTVEEMLNLDDLVNDTLATGHAHNVYMAMRALEMFLTYTAK